MLALEAVSVRFGSVKAVDEVSFDAARGELVCLLGASGSGKSTLLRAIAGIERPTAGRIFIGGVEVAGPHTFVEPEHRRVGMVFQDYALFPHLTVEANVAFGTGARRETVASLLGRLGLERLARSYPHELSGGERQRVALARAMAPQPRLLLMDEPFSSLDSQLREDVRRHTLELVRSSGTTTVIVTHEPDEALRIADRIVLLDRGRLVQVGTPEELYDEPLTLLAARFFSDVAPVLGSVTDRGLVTPLGRFPAKRMALGASGVACLRPQHFAIAAEATGVTGRVVSAQFCGDSCRVLVAIDGLDSPVALRAPRHLAARADALATGALVHLRIDTDEVPVVASA